MKILAEKFSVELNGIVFIQITVEVFTMAKLVPGEQQHMVQGLVTSYFVKNFGLRIRMLRRYTYRH